VVGAVLGLPGALYLTALHQLLGGNSSTAARVVAVFVFAIIEFTLIIIPLVLLAVRPEATAAMLARAQEWLHEHGRQLAACVALVLGVYLTISSLVSLLG
jgi:cadmium resistance protein CadD (predicted permease)